MTNFTSTLLKTSTNSTTQIQTPNPLLNSPEISLKRLDPTYPLLSTTASNILNNNHTSSSTSTAYSPNTLLLNSSNNNSASGIDGSSSGSSSSSSLSDSSTNILYKTTATLLPSPELENGANSIDSFSDGSGKILSGSKPEPPTDKLINYNSKFIPSSELMKFVENETMNRKLNHSVSDFEEVTVKQRFKYLMNWLVQQVKTSTYQSWLKFSVFLLVVVGICLAIFVFKVQNHLDILQEFVKRFGVFVGGMVYMGVFTLLIVFLIPVTIPTILGGIIFKPWFGILFVWGASLIGGTISFLLGRYVFRKSIAKKIEKNKKLLAVDQAIGQEGWKIVLLLRLTPIIPESLLNYALAVTRIKFRHYIICSSIGLIPGASFFIYLGTVIGSISEIKKVHIKKGEIALYIISGVVMIFTLLFLGIIVKRAVNKKLDQEESKGLLDEEEKVNDTNSDTNSTTPNMKSPNINFNFDEIVENNNISNGNSTSNSNNRDLIASSSSLFQNNNKSEIIEYSIN